MALSGGDKMDAHLKQVLARVGRGKHVRVGFLEGATYAESGVSVPLVAAANEYGDPARGRPPRPFFRTMIDAKAPGWGVKMGAALRSVNYDGEQALRIMGTVLRADLQASIREFRVPELAPSTVARKGFDKPLIDTATMLNSVGFDIQEGDGES